MSYPNYPELKDSGVGWLGRIPKHWEVTRVKFTANKIGSGKTPKGGAEVYLSEGIIFLRSQNVYDDGLRLDDVVYISEEVDQEMADTRVQPQDVLLNITGASIGRTCIVPQNFTRANVNQHVCIIRPKINAVTRGLDLSVKLRSSGIEWVSDIPAHWEVKKLKHIAWLKSGDSITSQLITEDDEYPVYGGNGLRGYTSSFTHQGSYVLIGRQGAWCGNINYASGKFWASEHAVVAELKSENTLFWFGELLRAMNLNQYSQSAAQPGLAVEFIQNLRIPVPPPTEQQSIAAFLDHKTAEIDGQVRLIEAQIEQLREYRQALISAAVTGKIDVRGESV